jgi:hypothetical protein
VVTAQAAVYQQRKDPNMPSNKTIKKVAARSAGKHPAAIIRATGGFFAGVARKKLGLTLQSKKIEGNRIYWIVAGKPSKAKSEPEDADRQPV